MVLRFILLMLVLVTPAAGDNFKEQDIIIIERNLNKNEVHYAVRIAHGRIDQEEPVVAYWIMKEKGGLRENLNWIEKRSVYGFNIKKDGMGDFYYMTFKGYGKRSIKVLVKDGQPKAEITINKAPAYFEKMYIYAVGSGFVPDIKYIELKGKDIKTGIPVSERLIP